jgi:hypothetical protein
MKLKNRSLVCLSIVVSAIFFLVGFKPDDRKKIEKFGESIVKMDKSNIKAIEQTNRQFSFQPGEIWKDNNGVHINAHGGGVLHSKGTYYWYGEHKVGGSLGNTAQVGVHVYSSQDLYNWKDEGIALKVSDDPQSELPKGCVLERPKVIFNKKTKKFVMWFHLELKDKGYDAARSGIAVSDNPVGPFIFIKSFRPNAGFWPVNVLELHKRPVI